MSEDYRVNLDIYSGPLDLLLYLIRRDEVDIYDIPISNIANQYMEYVDLIRTLDPNLAGEFLVMAATLMEIKTRMLLPSPPPAEDDDGELFDPRGELVRQLLEFKAFKDAAGDLWDSALQQAMSHPRRPAKPDTPAPEVDLADVQVWDLMEAFSRVLAEIGQGARVHEVIYDDTPIELHQQDILDLLSRDGRMTFRQIFHGRDSRSEIVGLFLATLQLVAQRQVFVGQDETFGDIFVELNPAPPTAEQLAAEEAELTRRAAERARPSRPAEPSERPAAGASPDELQQAPDSDYYYQSDTNEDDDDLDEDEDDDEDDDEFGHDGDLDDDDDDNGLARQG